MEICQRILCCVFLAHSERPRVRSQVLNCWSAAKKFPDAMDIPLAPRLTWDHGNPGLNVF